MSLLELQGFDPDVVAGKSSGGQHSSLSVTSCFGNASSLSVTLCNGL